MIRNLKITFVVTAVLFFMAMAGLAKAGEIDVGSRVLICNNFSDDDIYMVYLGNSEFDFIYLNGNRSYTLSFLSLKQDTLYNITNDLSFKFRRTSYDKVLITTECIQ